MQIAIKGGVIDGGDIVLEFFQFVRYRVACFRYKSFYSFFFFLAYFYCIFLHYTLYLAFFVSKNVFGSYAVRVKLKLHTDNLR